MGMFGINNVYGNVCTANDNIFFINVPYRLFIAYTNEIGHVFYAIGAWLYLSSISLHIKMDPMIPEYRNCYSKLMTSLNQIQILIMMSCTDKYRVRTVLIHT